MMFLSLLTLASLPAFSFAARTVTACVQTCGDLTTSCRTEYATDSVSVISTVTTTNTVPTTVTISSTETTYVLTTVTPSPITTTTTTTSTTVTTTTLSDVTDTLTVTETDTETDTATTTTTTTTTETDTTSTTTSTSTAVPTPSGFLPVQDTINGYPASKKAKRDQKWPSPGGNGTSGGLMASLWPNKVQCEVVSVVSETRIVFSTAAVNSTTTLTATATATEVDPTYTTLPAVDVTVTVTATVTSTSTQGPATDLATITTSTTTTTTTTTTETDTATTTTTTTMTFTSTSSSYDACGTANMIGPVYTNAGVQRTIVNFYNNGPNSGTTFTTGSATTAYDCCVQCITGTGCTSSLFDTHGTCYLIAYGSTGTGQCVQSQNPDFWTYSAGDVTGSQTGYTVSNSYCGYAYENGAE